MLYNSNNFFNEDGELTDLSHDHMDKINKEFIEDVTTKGLRCLAFGYKDFSNEDFEQLRKTHNDFKADSDREAYFFKELNLISILGLTDNIRPEATNAVKFARAGKINMILVSGDHKNTVLNYAVKANLISKEDVSNPESLRIISGEELRKKAGSIMQDNSNAVLERKESFRETVINTNLKIVYRATPEDKQLLAVGLKEHSYTVALTGEGISDVKGLEYSDVGFAMGSGVSAAKNSATMILVEDNVNSIINAVIWGRNIYSNSRKFIQF